MSSFRATKWENQKENKQKHELTSNFTKFHNKNSIKASALAACNRENYSGRATKTKEIQKRERERRKAHMEELEQHENTKDSFGKRLKRSHFYHTFKVAFERLFFCFYFLFFKNNFIFKFLRFRKFISRKGILR